jgi:predicted nucleic acid-binding protein
MYLVDTDVISEARKSAKGNAGVKRFFQAAIDDDTPLFISVVSIGELRQGAERMRHRGDLPQAEMLERWLEKIAADFGDHIIPFDEETAHIWGCLRVPHPDNPLDKQIAATALIHDLAVVTRNTAHFQPTGVRLLNPFS